jgi:hypothetical protein
MEQLGPHNANFHDNWYLCIFFSKICPQNSSFNKIWHEQWVLYKKDNIYVLLNSSWNEKCFRQKLLIKSKQTFYVQYLYFRKSLRLWDEEKYCRVGQALPILDTSSYTHSEYVIFIAFPLQQWLHQRASMLGYTYSTLPVLLFSFQCKFYSS